MGVPGSRGIARPQAIQVDLVALPPGGAPPAPRAVPAPAEAPAPRPPPPKPKEVVLPAKPRAPKPEPKPAPRREEVFRPPEPKQEERSLDEVLAEMRDQAGETPSEAPSEAVESAVVPSERAGAGVPVSAEVRDWMLRVRRHVQRVWVVPPGFRNEPLTTEVVIRLDRSGRVVGTPHIERRSGNPWFDEGVVRAIAKASPLPPPPEPGEWPFLFRPEDSF